MRVSGSTEVLKSLPCKKQGRPLLLADKIRLTRAQIVGRVPEMKE